MPRLISKLLFALSIASPLLLKAARFPDATVWLVLGSTLLGAILAHLFPVRVTGALVGAAGLFLAYRGAAEPPAALAGFLVFLAVLQLAAAGLLVAADISAAKGRTRA